MTQKDKELLLEDICSRLPYGVKCQIQEDEYTYIGTLCRIEVDNKNGHLLDFAETINDLDCQVYLSEIKPYLFPLSSMTEEQKNDMFNYCYNAEQEASKFSNGKLKFVYDYEIVKIDWCNKNNFDYRGLIEFGLAIDATNLNIY